MSSPIHGRPNGRPEEKYPPVIGLCGPDGRSSVLRNQKQQYTNARAAKIAKEVIAASDAYTEKHGAPPTAQTVASKEHLEARFARFSNRFKQA